MKRHAFTLVELLIVMGIIGILAALITVAVSGAMRTAKRTKIGIEMNQVTMALEAYKAEFGEYPPDGFDLDAVVRHIKKRFPRYDVDAVINAQPGSDEKKIKTALDSVFKPVMDRYILFFNQFQREKYPVKEIDYNTAIALAFLAGVPNGDGKLVGLSADSEHPFVFPVINKPDQSKPETWTVAADYWTSKTDKKQAIDLTLGENVIPIRTTSDRAALCIVDKSAKLPFSYFRGKTGGGEQAYTHGADIKSRGYFYNRLTGSTSGPADTATPYKKDANVWENADSFQLIHPGLDGLYGTSSLQKVIKTQVGISQADWDNITNFSDFNTVKSVMP